MALQSVKRVQSDDRVVNQIQDNFAAALQPLLKNPLNDGRLIKNISIETGTPKTIEHGLGRALQGWIITDRDAGATVWRTTSALPAKTLVLNASADVVLDIWVF